MIFNEIITYLEIIIRKLVMLKIHVIVVLIMLYVYRVKVNVRTGRRSFLIKRVLVYNTC